MKFDPGFNIHPTYEPLGFAYGKGSFGPKVENRKLDDIRKNLLDPACCGPKIVYSIAMDIGRIEDRERIIEKNLLYGAVTYAKGQLGKEPVRSQGHIHAISSSCNMSTCEVYEIWNGEAYIYMQEYADDYPGRCFAVSAKSGDIVIVPPGWVHCTITKDIKKNLTFGAWCVRDYGFDYKGVKAHKGVAWFPVVENNEIHFIANNNYDKNELIVKESRNYDEFGIVKGKPIYTQFIENPDKFLFVSRPQAVYEKWENFIP